MTTLRPIAHPHHTYLKKIKNKINPDPTLYKN